MKNSSKFDKIRLKNMIINDKMNSPIRFSEVIKNEIKNVLVNYVEMNNDDFYSIVDLDENGYYNIKLLIKAKRIKFFELPPR